MSFYKFLKERWYSICASIIEVFVLIGFSLYIHISKQAVLFCICVILMIKILGLYINYRSRVSYFQDLFQTINELDKKYLFANIMKKSDRIEDKQYYQLMQIMSKSMLEHINDIQSEKAKYQTYIEQWVHEVKAPISAIELICYNHSEEYSDKIRYQVEKIRNYVEQVLFYCKSEQIEKDFFIKKLNSIDLLHTVITANQETLLRSDICIKVLTENENIYSDERYIIFILNQLLLNAIQYKRKEKSVIAIGITHEIDKRIRLYVADNGIGVSKEDLPRVFDKGFTGNNGRKLYSSTGMGLFLCKKICDEMGIEIKFESKQNYYTKVSIILGMDELR